MRFTSAGKDGVRGCAQSARETQRSRVSEGQGGDGHWMPFERPYTGSDIKTPAAGRTYPLRVGCVSGLPLNSDNASLGKGGLMR
mgnify:CR=1 FL=1